VPPVKLETTKPAGRNFLQQQAKFDDFIACYNNERPHQALNMRYPAERYVPSTRPYRGLPELDYPFHDRIVTVTTCGRICFNRQKINLSVVFDLGYFDRLEPIANPFGPKVLGVLSASDSAVTFSEAARVPRPHGDEDGPARRQRRPPARAPPIAP
jgi:hypothetical protein